MIITNEYRVAPGGEGPHAGDWADKPHRLVYDLCNEIDLLQTTVAELVGLLRRVDEAGLNLLACDLMDDIRAAIAKHGGEA